LNLRIVFILIGLFSLPAQAAIEAYEFDSPQAEAEYYQLINELRCLVCQNQNLAGSDADLARDMRRETYKMLNAGKSPDEVVEFMVARYGDFVMYRPRFQTNTYLLWLGPVVLLVIVLFVFVRRLRASQAAAVDADALARARQLLEQDDNKP
jgi:cytochrome c-type biogenesis protein CcmH